MDQSNIIIKLIKELETCKNNKENNLSNKIKLFINYLRKKDSMSK